MYTREEKADIWLDGLVADAAKKLRLRALAGTSYALAENFSRLRGKVAELAGEGACRALEASLSSGYVREMFETYARKSVTCVTLSSKMYPAQLREIPDPPLVLYCRGDASLLARRMFTVVGSRHTPPAVLKQAERFARELSAHFLVLSGTADGGDSGVAVGVCGCGGVGGAEGGRVVLAGVGGEDEGDAGGVLAGDGAAGEGDGGGGVAADGLADDVGGGEVGEGVAGGGDEVGGGDDVDVGLGDEAGEAVDGLGDEGFAAEEGAELLGAGVGGEGPEAFATAAGEDEGVEGGGFAAGERRTEVGERTSLRGDGGGGGVGHGGAP